MTSNLSLPEVLGLPVERAARRLLGATLVRTIEDATLRVKIVEVEAYDQLDPASHTFRGESLRNASMFKQAGHAYVYFIYGMHYCLNIVAGPVGFGAGILIRAVEPLEGEAEMIINRGGRTGVSLTNGPSKLCEALAVTFELDGHDITQPPLQLHLQPALDDGAIVTTTRIGITKAADALRRFYIRDNPYVSKR
jgi:DNA-3-methyladenine glycosylase